MSDGQPFSLPEGFRFGVATAGFQIEGGYNGPGEPRNNWFGWEQAGRVEPSGDAIGFWDHYEHHLDKAVAAGCDAFRLSVEWARCEPAEGELDETAFDRYCAILDAAHDRGLQPLVTLHHFTHPWWLGEDFLLRLEAPERFARWTAVAVDRLRHRCRHWVTSNEVNILAVQTWMTGLFPPGRRGAVGSVIRSLDHLLAGHVLAYDQIHQRQADAVVSTNNYTFSVYELDRLGTDVLMCRGHGVTRAGLHAWLGERRATYHAAVAPVAGPERLLRRLLKAAVPLEQALPRTVAAVFDSPHRCTNDLMQVDYYAPIVSRHLRRPGHRTAGGRSWLPGTQLWDDQPDPEAFRRFLGLQVEDGLDMGIAENGLCNRVRNGRSYPRGDGWDRPRYLTAHLQALVAVIDAGVPVSSYYHWTLADNYEWGSYQPRFGLYGVDRARGNRWSDLDSLGQDAAGTYRRLTGSLREGERV